MFDAHPGYLADEQLRVNRFCQNLHQHNSLKHNTMFIITFKERLAYDS